jgi:hypothetical protein
MKLQEGSNKGFEAVTRKGLQWRFELGNLIPEIYQIMAHDVIVQAHVSDTFLKRTLKHAPKHVVRIQVPWIC